MFSTIWVKAGIVAAMVVAIWFGYWKWHDEVKQSGINECVAVQQVAIDKVVVEDTKEVSKDLEIVLAKRTEERDIALKVAEQLRRRNNYAITQQIKEVVKESKCTSFGDDSHRLLRDIIGEAPTLSSN